MLLEAETNKYCPDGNDFGAISNLITWVLNFFLSVSIQVRNSRCTLSMRVRNWWLRRAYESGTSVHWAYVSGTNVCKERSPFKTCWACASGIDVYPEHTGQELMRALSIRVRNSWCSAVYSAYKSSGSLYKFMLSLMFMNYMRYFTNCFFFSCKNLKTILSA